MSSIKKPPKKKVFSSRTKGGSSGSTEKVNQAISSREKGLSASDSALSASSSTVSKIFKIETGKSCKGDVQHHGGVRTSQACGQICVKTSKLFLHMAKEEDCFCHIFSFGDQCQLQPDDPGAILYGFAGNGYSGELYLHKVYLHL